MEVAIRDATSEDVEAIFSLGHNDHAFVVSERIPFYEKEELVEWIGRRQENVLCVVEIQGSIVGFCYCKIMSFHWAVLDNFYLVPEHRGHGAGRLLLQALVERLRARDISYVSTLLEAERHDLATRMQRFGFKQTKRYDWYELFLR